MVKSYVVVRVKLFKGARDHGVGSGYRPSAFFGERKDGYPVHHDFELELVDRDRLEPGETAQAHVVPFSPEVWPARAVGDRIRIYEGSNHVGDAYVESMHLDS